MKVDEFMDKDIEEGANKEDVKEKQKPNLKSKKKLKEKGKDLAKEQEEADVDAEPDSEVAKDSKDLKIDELNDKLIRNMAEFENFRKRSEKEKSNMYTLGVRSIVEEILPVIDNFQRGLESISEEEKEEGFAQGIDKIYKQLMSTLEAIGVKPIEAVGEKFDPNFHNAVMHAEDEEYEDNTISEEFQKGYMYKDTVVRHSMVKVVN